MTKKVLSVSILLFILIGVYYLMINMDKPSEPTSLSSGGSDTHWYHTSGTILSKDSEDHILRIQLISLEEDTTFQEDELLLDCSKQNLSISSLEPGDTITFYYFKSNVSNATVKVEEIIK